MVKLLSDQVSEQEIAIILRELRHVLENRVPGDVVELGCYVGTTSMYLARELSETDKQFYVYDSFEGLPPKTHFDDSPVGIQFATGELAATKRLFVQNMRHAGVKMPVIKKAWFSDLVDSDIPDEISYAFLDGDYYDSIRQSLSLVWPRLQPGAIVLVDDYMNEALPGAAKAVDEWLRVHMVTQKRVEASLAILVI